MLARPYGPAPTFESFDVSRWNAEAHQLAMQWSRGELDAVLVLAGRSRCGKTNLASAAAATVETRGRSVLAMSAADWTSKLVAAFRADGVARFHREVGGYDAMVIEHLEDLDGKESTREELAVVVRAVRPRGGQVLLTVTGMGGRARAGRLLRRMGGLKVATMRVLPRALPSPATSLGVVRK